MDKTMSANNDSEPAIFLWLWLDSSKKSEEWEWESRPKEENVFD